MKNMVTLGTKLSFLAIFRGQKSIFGPEIEILKIFGQKSIFLGKKDVFWPKMLFQVGFVAKNFQKIDFWAF